MPVGPFFTRMHRASHIHTLGTRGGPQVCRVTNTGQEKPPLDTRIVNEPVLLAKNGKPLYLEVETDVFDGAADETISQEDMDYWFRADEEVLSTQYLEPMGAPVPNSRFEVRNLGVNQKPWGTLQDGQVLTGELTGLHLLHGAVVDLGCDFDGLIPISGDQWTEIIEKELLDLGDTIKVRVHKIRDVDIFRFPVQLEVLEPDLSHILPPPDTWRCPIEIRADSDMDKVLEVGRPDYKPTTLDIQTGVRYFDEDLAADIELVNMEDKYGNQAPKPVDASSEVAEEIEMTDAVENATNQVLLL